MKYLLSKLVHKLHIQGYNQQQQDSSLTEEQREYIKDNFNEVDTLTAVFKGCNSFVRCDYKELKVGKRYHISHIGVLRSSTYIILYGFGYNQYNSACFDVYENGEIIEYTKDTRFWAPYLKKLILG